MSTETPTTLPDGPREGDGMVPIKTALLSLSDKTGLTTFGTRLDACGIGLISTGGTAAALREAGLGVRDVSAITEFPEILGGRVKTLHPMIHGGLLGDLADPDHRSAMHEHGIGAIGLLVVNLYPFEAAVARGAEFDECLETIDIGGPAMIRAAAKNHGSVTVLTDPQDYEPVLAEIERHGGTTAETRRRLAATAFARTAAYDAAVASWLSGALGEPFPRRKVLTGRLVSRLRYGENPHQEAGFYADGSDRPGVAVADLLQGKTLSYNNIADTDAAFEAVAEFYPNVAAACVIVKHGNPCGAAVASSLEKAYRAARECDETSAFGGIVALNRRLDAPTAAAIREIFTEVVIAPGADDEARAVLAEAPNLRLLVTEGVPDPTAPRLAFKAVSGGLLVQDADLTPPRIPMKVVSRRPPTVQEIEQLDFAWRIAKHVKSNAIVLAQASRTIGIGAGQMSRFDSARMAFSKSQERAKALGQTRPPTRSAAAASDAFFPFPDSIDVLATAGITAVIQPGGSVRDEEVIAAIDKAGMAMVFTGLRHFRH